MKMAAVVVARQAEGQRSNGVGISGGGNKKVMTVIIAKIDTRT